MVIVVDHQIKVYFEQRILLRDQLTLFHDRVSFWTVQKSTLLFFKIDLQFCLDCKCNVK